MTHVPSALVLLAIAAGAAQHLIGCTAAQGKAIEKVITRLGCELVGVVAHDEQVGTLCSDIAPAVEDEIARAFAEAHRADGNLLGHRTHRHHRPVRVAEHIAGRRLEDGESIEPPYLDAVKHVLARRAQGLP